MPSSLLEIVRRNRREPDPVVGSDVEDLVSELGR